MRFFDELVMRAGFSNRRSEVLVLILGSSVVLGSLVAIGTGVIGLGACIGILFLAAGIEALRLKAESRQRHQEASWPQVFDAFQSAAVSGIRNVEQFEYLATRGPLSHQRDFLVAREMFEIGRSESEILQILQNRFSSRQGDLLVRLIELESELGGVGMAKTFRDAAHSVRQEQAELGQLLAKQGWVALSAKIALFAPWLIAAVLVQLEQNREAFGTQLGSLVLALGLVLSLFAYALVNKLGYLPLPRRVLNGS